MFSYILSRLKKFATLLPNNWLAETPQACAEGNLADSQRGKERISEINYNFLK
ncbi:hypothetical protein KEH51_28895 [[Brevibacterium] frigoritolerans]|uniref:Uncharacterized protein n=1 Tax=Peribacillus frigoritolerans TaxID=450367 RepID=A0A941J3U5_9BACI|nr:hypothetical protein [Peribacillus frigoritolerans]